MEYENRIENLYEIYLESFNSLQLSSQDKKLIKEAIKSNGIEKREKDLIRSKIFDLARDKFSSETDRSIINWLEEANKSLFSRQNKNSENEAFFSPGEECVSAIISRIKLATQSIKVCVFTISDDRIADSLIQAQKLGILVKVITDNDKIFDEG
jgi:phosphatidylserine/phosphatidylglycerophosphate/cardiolipin synthase-like enzyme